MQFSLHTYNLAVSMVPSTKFCSIFPKNNFLTTTRLYEILGNVTPEKRISKK